MKIAVNHLARTFVSVPVVRNADRLPFLLVDFLSVVVEKTSIPVVFQIDEGSSAFGIGLWKRNAALAHRLARCHGYSALLGIVYGAIEVIDHAVVLYHITLVSKKFVVWL